MFRKLPPQTGAPYDLRVDGRPSPALGIAGAEPRLAWRLPPDLGDADRLLLQAAHTSDDLQRGHHLLWTADLPVDQIAVGWEGSPLSFHTEVHWRIGGAAGASVHWSPIAVFEPALRDDEWRAQWVTSPDWADPDPDYNGPPPVLGRDFSLASPVRRARLYAASGGVLDITLNGMPAGEAVLSPGYSVTAVRVPALAWDVTRALTVGLNRLRVTVAPGISWVPAPAGRYTKQTTAAMPPRLLTRLEIELEDGTTAAVVSDGTWRATTGPVRQSHWYGGEDIDGRIDDTAEPIAATDAWEEVATLGDADIHRVWWTTRPNLTVAATLPGVVVRETEAAVTVDVGTNIAGWPVLHLRGVAAGRRIEVRPAELLDPDGVVDQRTTGSPIWDSYLTRQGDQTWHPRHVYHGFRYLEIRGVHRDELDVEAWVIRAANQPVGELAISDPFLATLHRIIDRAVQGNMYSVFTDCPNREKLGWIEQLHLCFGLLARLYDVEAHLRDTLSLMRDAQRPTGLIPSTVPETFDFTGAEWQGDRTAFIDDVNWGGAIAWLTLLHYREYGDRRVLTENWPAVDRYLDHVHSRADGGIVDFGLGDWIALDESTPRALVATYGYIRLLRAAATIRRELGRADQAAELERRAALALDAFAGRFRRGETWGSASQASYALALDLGAVTADAQPDTFAALVESIHQAGDRLTVGENSWPALLRVLHRGQRDDLIDALVRTGDGPGYGLQLKLGATALTETWRGASGAMYENSQNHFMLGMVDDWIVGEVVGLAQDPDSIAWSKALVAPTPLPAVQAAATAYTTPRGTYRIDWTAGARPSCLVEIPAGGTAEVRLPPDWRDRPPVGSTLGAGRWEWVS